MYFIRSNSRQRRGKCNILMVKKKINGTSSPLIPEILSFFNMHISKCIWPHHSRGYNVTLLPWQIILSSLERFKFNFHCYGTCPFLVHQQLYIWNNIRTFRCQSVQNVVIFIAYTTFHLTKSAIVQQSVKAALLDRLTYK